MSQVCKALLLHREFVGNCQQPIFGQQILSVKHFCNTMQLSNCWKSLNLAELSVIIARKTILGILRT